MEVEKISKLDAACRQLNTAISLWFNDGDIVSIHTLACSAHQIVHDINQQRGGRDLIYDSLNIKDEYRREANRLLKHPYNFFKHAENDAFDAVELKPSLTELFILFTSVGLKQLGCQSDPIREAFNIYYIWRNPHLLTEKGKSEWNDKISAEIRKQSLDMPKRQFFESYLIMRNCIREIQTNPPNRTPTTNPAMFFSTIAHSTLPHFQSPPTSKKEPVE